MAVTKEQILAALKKLGPSKPGEIARHLEVDKLPPALLMQLLHDKEIKAAGQTSGRRLALPDQDFGAPVSTPKDRPAPKKRKAKKSKRKAPRARAAALPPKPTLRFIPVVDADMRLHIINDAVGVPLSFNESQTEAIATLLFQHYTA